MPKTKNTKTKKTDTNKKTQTKEKKQKKKIYFSFGQRVCFNTILFLVLLSFGTIFLIKSFDIEKGQIIKYSEHSNLDYKVYLKENNFYEQEYLEKDMIYIANLINKIKVDFNYNFNIETKTNMKFNYKIIGKLQIMDSEGKFTYYEKEYTLLNDKQLELTNNISQTIRETIEINYNEYNKIANDFKNTYGIGTTSKLIIYFYIDKTPLDNNFEITNGINNIILSIPLSEKSINIDMDYKDIKNQSYITDNTKIIIDNIIHLVLAIIFIIISITYAIKTIRLLEKLHVKKNIYDIYINKILNEYDRLIVETTTPPILYEKNKENIILIEKFTELLDVRDNLKQPIMHYTVTKHEKCHFYIINNNKIYLNTIKKVDLEASNEK